MQSDMKSAQTILLSLYVATKCFESDDAFIKQGHKTLEGAAQKGIEVKNSSKVMSAEEVTEKEVKLLLDWLKKSADHHCHIIWPHPIPWLAANMDHGKSAKEILWLWCSQANAIVDFYKKNRSQVTLEGYVPGVVGKDQYSFISSLTLEKIPSVNLLMASQLLLDEKFLQQSYNYLKASSAQVVPFGMSSLELVEKCKEEATQPLVAEQLVEENELLLEQLMVVQEELEIGLIKLAELESLKKDHQLVLTQLHQAQEQLVKNTAGTQYYKKQSESRQKTINVLKQEQQVIRHQFERITQWLRTSGQRHAAAAYRYSRPFKRALPKQLASIKASSFFDEKWYCEQYPDVKKSSIDPAEHYLKFGAIEGRNPSDRFDTYFYLCEYPDVAASGQNPLLHYIRYGQHEERLPAKPRKQLPAPIKH